MTDQADNLTPSPPSSDRAAEGGGNPSAPADVGVGAQISPASVFSEGVSAIVETLPAAVDPDASERLEDVELRFRWDGTPTRQMVRALRDVVRCPGFDPELAGAVLVLMGDGMTLIQACESAGVKRGVIRAWCRLIPEFGEMVSTLETELGSYWRDRAAAEAESGDPARVSARLKVAAAYDRRMARGDEGGSGATTVNVQVVW
jgi:hypothetical protein